MALAIFSSGGDDSTGGGPAAAGLADRLRRPSRPAAAPKQYESPPPLELIEGVDYSAVISTSCGDLELDLSEDPAVEQNVANFVFLAREGFYNGLTWHRVEKDSVIQAGDPDGVAGVPPDGPGYTVPDEPPSGGEAYTYGVVGIANQGIPDSGGSQFFIVLRPPGSPVGYPPNYAIVGQIAKGSYDVLDTIQSQPVAGVGSPAEAVVPVVPIYINSIEITES